MNDTKISLWFNKAESCITVSRKSNTERVNLGIKLHNRVMDLLGEEFFNKLEGELLIQVEGEIAEKISNLVFID